MTENLHHALVVEDNPVARWGVSELLKRRGFDVKAAQNGEEALQCLQVEPLPEVIVLDMFMPIIDGWHFLARFNQLKLEPKPWVIVMTGSEVIDRVWAEAHGCGGFLRKPIEETGLAEEIKRCLTRTAEIPAYQPPHSKLGH